MTLTDTCPSCLGQRKATPTQLAGIRGRAAVAAGIALWQVVAMTLVIGALARAESWSALAIVLVTVGVITPSALFGVANVFLSRRARQLHQAADRG
jgi:hypothetical protein